MRSLALFFVPLVALACGSDDAARGETPVTEALFAPAAAELSGDHFFDHPFPSDLRRDAQGAALFDGWPNPTQAPLLDAYKKVAKGLFHGFSPATAAYLRFSGPLDPGSLPADPPATTASDASVQLVDVDDASPERGKRALVTTHWQADQGVFWQPNTLAVMPILGRPLRPKTRYALVVTTKARAANGATLAQSRALREALGIDAATDATRAAHDLFAPAVAALESAGLAAKDIAHMTVFTTNDPTEELFAVMDDVARAVPAPSARDMKRTDEAATHTVYEGMYGPSPNYQVGKPPFGKPADGGQFSFEGGKPKLVDTFDLRFALAVPDAQRCPPPAEGYPIVLYAHGTGGDYRSFVSDGTASSLASQCLATMGIDQIFHGTRPGAPALDDPQREQTIQFLFFNFDNAAASRTSNRQAAVDVVQQARLFTEGHVKVPASISKTGQEVGFDGTRLSFFGHSQGGLNGPLFLAGSSLARGGVLSGAASVLAVSLLEKSKPIDVAATMRLLVGLSSPDSASELNVFHPAMTLLQSLIDAADPLHYGSFIIRSPRSGAAPKSIFQTEGVAADGRGDSYAPPHGIEALAVAIGLPRVAPGVRPVKEAEWAGLADTSIPAEGLQGNLGGGRATGVLAQFVPQSGKDGHFVVFNDPKARLQAASFLKNLADAPPGRVPLAP